MERRTMNRGMKQSLYELTGEYLELKNLIEDEEVDPQVIEDTLESVGGEIEDKAEGYAKIIKGLEGDAQTLETEIKRMSEEKRVIENRIASLKKNLQEAMIATGKTKFKTDLFSFRIQKNPPTCKILVAEKNVPDEFKTFHDPTINKMAVTAYLKEHGDQKWAILTQGESLRIS